MEQVEQGTVGRFSISQGLVSLPNTRSIFMSEKAKLAEEGCPLQGKSLRPGKQDHVTKLSHGGNFQRQAHCASSHTTL